jgi:hypothetical protein
MKKVLNKINSKIMYTVALALALTLGLQAFQPREAKAVLLVEAASGGYIDFNVPEIVLCVVALPICLLDQKAAPASAYSRQDLLDNGYSADQVALIEHDQTVVMTALQAKHEQMVVQRNDTRMTLARALRGIDPHVSEEYIGFVADTNHLN